MWTTIAGFDSFSFWFVQVDLILQDDMLSFGLLCLSYGCKIMDKEMSQFDCLFGIMHELEFGGNFYKVVEGNMWHGFWIKNKS